MLASQVVQKYGLTPARTDSWAKQFPRGTCGDRAQLWRKHIQPWWGRLPTGLPARQTVCGWRFSNGRPDFLGKRTEAVSLSCKRGEEKDMRFISRRERNCNHGAGSTIHEQLHTHTQTSMWSLGVKECFQFVSGGSLYSKNKIKRRKEGRKKKAHFGAWSKRSNFSRSFLHSFSRLAEFPPRARPCPWH